MKGSEKLGRRGCQVKPDLGRRKAGIDVNDRDCVLTPEALIAIDHHVLPPDPDLENPVLKRNCYHRL